MPKSEPEACRQRSRKARGSPYTDSFPVRILTVPHALPSQDNFNPAYADGGGNLEGSFACLKDFVDPMPPKLASLASLLALKRIDAWIGRSSVSTLHFDNVDNLFAQVMITSQPGNPSKSGISMTGLCLDLIASLGCRVKTLSSHPPEMVLGAGPRASS